MTAKTPPQIFDAAQLLLHKRRALKSNRFQPFLFEEAALRLDEHLDCMQRDFTHALNLHPFNALWHEKLSQRTNIANISAISPLSSHELPLANLQHTAPEEPLPPAQTPYDLVTSSLSLHWINDLPGLLIQLYKRMQTNGLLLINLFGAGTLEELRLSMMEADKHCYGGIAPRVIPFIEVKTLGMLLQRAGFEMPITDTETITVHYPDMLTLLHDLRYMGETNALNQRSKKPITREWLRVAQAYYRTHYGDGEGGIKARFEILSATALTAANPSM